MNPKLILNVINFAENVTKLHNTTATKLLELSKQFPEEDETIIICEGDQVKKN